MLSDKANGNADVIKDTTTASFMKDVMEESLKQPVIVDFWSPRCMPCKQLTPVLEKLVLAEKGRVKLVKMDIDAYPEIAGQLRIQSVPTVYAFSQGQPVNGFVGNQPESSVKTFIQSLLDSVSEADPVGELLEEAGKRAESGDAAGAAELYAHILAQDPEHIEALAALVKLHLQLKDIEGAKRFLDMVPEKDRDNAAIQAVRSAVELAEQAAALGDRDDLQKRVANDPNDFQARLDLSVILNAHGKKAEATDLLIDIMKKDRGWNDEAARKQLLQFFETWGATDPHVREGRRKLSSLLFS